MYDNLQSGQYGQISVQEPARPQGQKRLWILRWWYPPSVSWAWLFVENLWTGAAYAGFSIYGLTMMETAHPSVRTWYGFLVGLSALLSAGHLVNAIVAVRRRQLGKLPTWGLSRRLPGIWAMKLLEATRKPDYGQPDTSPPAYPQSPISGF